MENFNLPALIIPVLVVAYAGWRIWYHYNRRCPRCNGKLRLEEYRDSMGHNIAKKVTISFWNGPRRTTEIWRCRQCGHELVENSWSAD